MVLQNRIGPAVIALIATFTFQGHVQAQVTFDCGTLAEGGAATRGGSVTYAVDVATIIQKNCTVCHRPGGIGPINLIDYDDA